MTSPFRDIGTVATHTCEDGFVLVGAGTRECEVGGMWSESTPTCERKRQCVSYTVKNQSDY